jgi:hypothetical protein
VGLVDLVVLVELEVQDILPGVLVLLEDLVVQVLQVLQVL